MKLSIVIVPSRLLKVLMGLAAALVLLDISALLIDSAGLPIPEGFVRVLSLDEEESIGTWYAVMLLMLAAIAGLTVALIHNMKGLPYVRHWFGLAAVFMALSIDEGAAIHEGLIGPTRDFLGVGGILYYAWIIPAFAFVAVFAVAYLRFLTDIPRNVALLFIVSGAIYVGSAGGLEMAEAAVIQDMGPEASLGLLLSTFQEALEMVGVSLFIYALAAYLRNTLGVTNLSLGSEYEDSSEAEDRVMAIAS